jgi:cytochrome c553
MKHAPLLLVAVLAFAGCRRDMFNQPRYKTYSANPFFADGASARPLPPHTIARGAADLDTGYYEGKTDDGKLLEAFPMPVTRAVLDRGQQRFEIYCSVCHGRTGDGNGMIVQRGFPAPPSFHIDRLRNAPAGHIYDVITNGHGVMYSYADRVAPADRWAIASYIRALQLSHHATLEDVPPGERDKLQTQ